ncbi:MAG: hypothetical protein ABIH11_01330 [Candidatus Altiarchaeota archaeon]
MEYKHVCCLTVLISLLSPIIVGAEVNCVQTSDDLLNKARAYYVQEDYALAREYAVNASRAYGECPYASGSVEASKLLRDIREKMNGSSDYSNASLGGVGPTISPARRAKHEDGSSMLIYPIFIALAFTLMLLFMKNKK